MSEAKLPKLVIYPQHDATMPSIIYGTATGLQTLAAAINNVLVANKDLNTNFGEGTNTHFQIADEHYELKVFIGTDEFISTLPAPFVEHDDIEKPVTTELSPTPAIVKMWRDVYALTPEWADYSPIERAYRVVKAYENHKIRNRMSPEMLITAMRKMPDWYQNVEAFLNMAKALNAVIDLQHPDTLVLRTELDAANKRIKELKALTKDLQEELLPI